MQDQEDQVLQPESPTPVPEIKPGPVVPPSLESDSEETAKSSRTLRKVLLWAVGLVIVFAVGVMLVWTLQVRPQAAQIASQQSEILTAKEQTELLSEEVQGLRPLAEQNTQLREELSSAKAHLDLLNVLVDVTTAQLALAQEDVIAARAALTGTIARVRALESTLEGADADAVSEMSGRLQLVLEELESDSFAARRDLEILANNLLALERVLFGE